MKKNVLAAALSLLLLAASVTAAYAETSSAGWNVTFTAENALESDYTAANLGSKVYEMQPGDTVNLTLHLKNANAARANWYMSNEVLQSLEESGNSASGGAYEYELVYTDPAGGQDILYTSDAVGGELAASDRLGLKNATEGLEDFFYLDTLEPNAEAVVTLRVSLDGETQGNSYQSTLARLQLNFAVDPVVERTETVTRTEIEVVQTGDQNRSLPFLIAAGVSGLLLLLLALGGMRARKKGKKNAGKLLCFLLAALLFCLSPAVTLPAHAAETRTYTVRLYPGAQGSLDLSRLVTVYIEGQRSGPAAALEDGVCVLRDLPYGAQIIFHTDEETEGGVVLNTTENADSKYYVRGVRESGQDNSSVASNAFSVTGDADYVVAYGIRGEMVAYTIRFEDEAGNELAPALVRHGNIGDRPVVAYQYIENYRPQAYNLTKTLSANAEENVFTFTYTPIEVNTVVQTVVIPGTVVTVVPGPGVVVPPPEEVIPGPETPLVPGGEETPGQGGTGAPEEIIDLDETPLGLFDALGKDFATALTGLSLPVRLGVAAGIVGIGALLVLLFVSKKRKKKDAKES